MPAISVVIPVYNTESCLERCIESVFQQDFEDFELLLMDDGSSDGSGAVCDRFAEKDRRVKVFHLEHGGVSRARNAGIEVAEGTFIAFVDSDDTILPHCLSALWDEEVDFSVGGFERRKDDETIRFLLPVCRKYNRIERRYFFEDNLLVSTPFDGPCAKLFRKSVIEEHQLRFNEALDYAEDKLFVYNYLLYAKTFKVTECVVYIQLRRKVSLSSDILSDKHICQLLSFLPFYTKIVEKLRQKIPSKATSSLYHQEVTGRYVYRILNIFKDRKSDVQTMPNVAYLAKLLAADNRPPMDFDGKYVVISYYVSKYFGKYGLYVFMSFYNLFTKRQKI